MTAIEISTLIRAYTKLLHNELESMKDTIIGDFEGVRLEADEYEIIKPFLFMRRKAAYQIGDVTLTTDGVLNAASVGTDDYALIRIPDDEMVFLYDAIKSALLQEQCGHRIKFKKYSK